MASEAGEKGKKVAAYDFAQSQKAEQNAPGNAGTNAKRVTKRVNFVSPNEKAKSAVCGTVRTDRAQGPAGGYDDFLSIYQHLSLESVDQVYQNERSPESGNLEPFLWDFTYLCWAKPKIETVTETLGDFVRYGYVALPLWVFAEQLGIPIPAAPILLAAGAVAGTGRMNLAFLTVLALAGALTADLIWYRVGYAHGSRALGRLCRLCLEPDSCVRRAKNLLERHGLRSLLVAKFVPGLNAVAAPVAGTIRIPWWQFAAVDVLGILIWATSFELLGFVFAGQLERVAVYAWRMSAFLVAAMIIAALAAVLVRKHLRRQRFLQDLRIARISPEELKQKLDRHEPVTVIDLRHSLDFLPEPYTIPGALRIPMEDLDKRNHEIPRDQEVVLYCTCPNEASSAMTAIRLKKYGISKVRPLHGGFHMWRGLGFPVESEFGPVPTTIGQPARCATCGERSAP